MPDHRAAGAVSESTPITVSANVPAGLRVAHVDAERGERAVLEVEAREPELRRRPEAEVRPARGDRRVDDGEVRVRREARATPRPPSRTRARWRQSRSVV